MGGLGRRRRRTECKHISHHSIWWTTHPVVIIRSRMACGAPYVCKTHTFSLSVSERFSDWFVSLIFICLVCGGNQWTAGRYFILYCVLYWICLFVSDVVKSNRVYQTTTPSYVFFFAGVQQDWFMNESMLLILWMNHFESLTDGSPFDRLNKTNKLYWSLSYNI